MGQLALPSFGALGGVSFLVCSRVVLATSRQCHQMVVGCPKIHCVSPHYECVGIGGKVTTYMYRTPVSIPITSAREQVSCYGVFDVSVTNCVPRLLEC